MGIDGAVQGLFGFSTEGGHKSGRYGLVLHSCVFGSGPMWIEHGRPGLLCCPTRAALRAGSTLLFCIFTFAVAILCELKVAGLDFPVLRPGRPQEPAVGMAVCVVNICSPLYQVESESAVHGS